MGDGSCTELLVTSCGQIFSLNNIDNVALSEGLRLRRPLVAPYLDYVLILGLPLYHTCTECQVPGSAKQARDCDSGSRLRKLSDENCVLPRLQYNIGAWCDPRQLPGDTAGEGPESVLFLEPEVTPDTKFKNIKMKSIVDGVPEARLAKLLVKHKFKEVEEFCVLFQVDIEEVHRIRAQYLCDLLNPRRNDGTASLALLDVEAGNDLTEELLTTLEKIRLMTSFSMILLVEYIMEKGERSWSAQLRGIKKSKGLVSLVKIISKIKEAK
ncbi:hypothetical protein E2C01_016349 [Portunus trituberculatus]|uniref:KNTC1 first ARM-repeats domain-containing protein n=1 Tax=Portunus trituberculatus TaxID=210409 RepID=A0A5B7DQ14_PORTR|nr:hypothetical protein [Portunus trituberculatus]